MQTKRNILVIIVLAMVSMLTSCTGGMVYSSFQTVSGMGWDKDSVLTYTIPAPDTTEDYRLLLHVRHNERYPYQNMWVFIDAGMQHDTLEFYLADERGIWLGNRGGSHIAMPVVYEDSYRFREDTLQLRIIHGMREDVLRGISEIGIEVQRKKR